MHRARAEVAQGQAERERLAAELHETRSQIGYEEEHQPLPAAEGGSEPLSPRERGSEPPPPRPADRPAS